MQFWLQIKDANFSANIKDVEMGVWDGVADDWKHARKQIPCGIIPQEAIRQELKEGIMKVFGEELEKYLDSVFKE